MVRLKLFHKFLWSCLCSVTSQFHYGSIKTYTPSLVFSKIDLSQFHYGSIKTEYLYEIMDIDVKSQFHYGSIKTK